MLLLNSGTAAAPRNNRQALRSATRKIHDHAEAFWSVPPGAAFPMRRFLTAMLGLHRRLGRPAAVTSRCDHAEDIETRRIEALERDLNSTAPEARAPLAPGSDAAWGVLYALNGSAMGAGVLLQALPAGSASEYLTVMTDYAKSGQLGAFYRALNQQALNQSAAEAGSCLVFSEMTR